MAGTEDNAPINAEPTKSFFVDMLTRDIPLEQAVLDLVDNAVDAAKAKTQGASMEGLEVNIQFDRERFSIRDNCGGFSKDAARDYAFRFGRAKGSPSTPHSIGQFGVGMKRALFKFGRHFTVRSATQQEGWAVDVRVPEWEAQDDWHFPWATFTPDEKVATDRPGTEIDVTDLRTEVGYRFSTRQFHNLIVGLVKSKHRQFISTGLRISVNGEYVNATNLFLLSWGGQFAPGVDEFVVQEEESLAPVKIKIVVGVGLSQPKEAGWYVVCNGRVILEADRRSVTGWGVVEDETESVTIPGFHNQFARFRGLVTFDSEDSSRVPWNTMKTDVNQDSAVWQRTYSRMTEMMRPVITFLNELDADIDEHTKEGSALHELVASTAQQVKADSFSAKTSFKAPPKGSIKKAIPTVKVQYSRPVEQVEFLQEQLGVSTAKAVGEKAFDLTYQRMGGK